MKRKPKIAIYSGDIPSTTFIERLIEGLSLDAYEIYVFGFIKTKVKYQGSVSVYAYKNNRAYKLFYLLKYTVLLSLFKRKEKRRLDSIIKSQSKNVLLDKVKSYPVLWHKPDIFHLQWVKGIEQWMWVQEFGIKLVISLRGAHINYSPLANNALAEVYRKNFPLVDGFHAVSKAIAKEAEKYNASADKIEVIYSGLPNTKQAILKRMNKKFHILSVGRAHWKKGYSYALDACRALKDENFEFKYTIVGASKSIECQYQVADLELFNEVVLEDNLPYDRVQEMIQQSDILLLPSVEEGIANVVLEAMSNHTLVLTTNCGGMTEVINDGVNGFVIPYRNVEAITRRIKEISKLSIEESDAVRVNAIATLKAEHTQSRMVKNMSVLYQNILQC